MADMLRVSKVSKRFSQKGPKMQKPRPLNFIRLIPSPPLRSATTKASCRVKYIFILNTNKTLPEK